MRQQRHQDYKPCLLFLGDSYSIYTSATRFLTSGFDCKSFLPQDVLKADDSLKRSVEEIAVLDSYASIKSPLASYFVLCASCFINLRVSLN